MTTQPSGRPSFGVAAPLGDLKGLIAVQRQEVTVAVPAK